MVQGTGIEPARSLSHGVTARCHTVTASLAHMEETEGFQPPVRPVGTYAGFQDRCNMQFCHVSKMADRVRFELTAPEGARR